jgi:2-methylisocitrate lyase-like PEP mutase family enzyme
VVERGEFLAKIKAAVAARHDPDFMIIARTDARAVVGLDEAVARMNEALAAGADLAFLEAAETIEEVAAVPRRVEGSCLLNIVPGGKTPVVDLREAQAMGYRVAILPGLLLTTAIDSCASALAALKATHVPPMPKHGASVLDTFRRFDADAWSELRTRFKTESGGSNRERR